jgi:hypothetical protein
VIRVRDVLIVLLAGSVWGIAEAVGGGYLYAQSISHAAIPVSLVGLTVLALARFLVPMKGSSLVIAGVAIGYRWLNAGLFPCHLTAILALGGVFEVAASSIGAERMKERALQSVLGIVTGFVGFALFAGIMAYGIRDAFWVGNTAKITAHLLDGVIVGAAGAALVPVACAAGQRMGSWIEAQAVARPRVSFGLIALVLVICWLV